MDGKAGELAHAPTLDAEKLPLTMRRALAACAAASLTPPHAGPSPSAHKTRTHTQELLCLPFVSAAPPKHHKKCEPKKVASKKTPPAAGRIEQTPKKLNLLPPLSLTAHTHAATRDLDLYSEAESMTAALDGDAPPPLQGDLICYFSPGEARVTGLRTGLTRACAARGAPRRIPIGTGRLVGLRVGVDLEASPPAVTSLEFTIDDGDGGPWRTAVCGGSRAARTATAGGVAVDLPPGSAVSAIDGACAGPDDLRLDANTVYVRATYAAPKYPCVFFFFFF